DRQQQRVGNAALRGDKAVRPLVADHLAHLFGENRGVLEPMAVAVDHRVADLLASFFGLVIAMRAHTVLRRGSWSCAFYKPTRALRPYPNRYSCIPAPPRRSRIRGPDVL